MFSADAKDEVAAARFACLECAAIFIAALARFSNRGSLARAGLPPDRVAVVSDRVGVARAALRAGRDAGIAMHSRALRERRLRGRNLVAVLAEKAIGGGSRPPSKPCCRRAWLRAAFLACGSVSDPRRAYHLEFSCPNTGLARSLRRALASFGIESGLGRRRGRALVYAKGASTVVDILGHLGAARAVLAFDDVLAVRATKNAIRRRVNSEAANAARAAASAARQREAALRLRGRARFAELTTALREAVKLRIAHPTATLRELAREARPPVTKPAMGSRMRTLERLARYGKSQSGRGAAGRRLKV